MLGVDSVGDGLADLPVPEGRTAPCHRHVPWLMPSFRNRVAVPLSLGALESGGVDVVRLCEAPLRRACVLFSVRYGRLSRRCQLRRAYTYGAMTWRCSDKGEE